MSGAKVKSLVVSPRDIQRASKRHLASGGMPLLVALLLGAKFLRLVLVLTGVWGEGFDNPSLICLALDPP